MYKALPIPLWMLLCFFALSHTTETVCTAALPILAKSFGVTGNLAQSTSSIYFAGFALGVLTLGRISDLLGRRPLILIGLFIYSVSSILCSFASTIDAMFVLRFIQAFGVSVGSVVAQAMARDSFKGKRLAEVFVSIAIFLSFVPSLGSSIGGYIVEYSGWQYNFRFLGIIGAILFVVSIFRLPETNLNLQNKSETSYFAVLKSILSNPMVLTYAFIVGSFTGMMFGFYLEAPFVFISYFKFTPSEYGKLGFLLTAAYLVGSLISRFLVLRIDNCKIIKHGLILSLIGCSSLFIGSIILNHNSPKLLAICLMFIPMMLQIIGHTLVIPIVLRFALEDYESAKGTAGSIFGFIYYVMVALINFTLSRLHGDFIMPFTTLFFMLSIICFMLFNLIEKNLKE